MRPLLERLAGSGREEGLIKPLHDRAINGEAGASEFAAARTGNQAILDEGQDLEFFTHLTSIALTDRVLCPFEQLRVPCRTVIQCIRRDSAHDVIRSKTIRQIGGSSG